MRFVDRFKFMFGSKASQSRIVSQLMQVGQAQATPVNYENLAKKGYSANVAVYTAINKICTAAGGINWKLYSGTTRKPVEVTDHALMRLFERPNPMQGQSSFLQSVIGFYLISGNSYIEKVRSGVGASGPTGPIHELWPTRPDKTKIIPGKLGYPAFYEFTGAGGTLKRYPVDQVTLKSDLAQWKTFNPVNDWYGLSPLSAAMLSLDVNNAGKQWNYSLLKNSANPSGVLQMVKSEANPRGEMTDAQYARIKKEFEEGYQGTRTAGKPLILEGGLNWVAMSLTPKEMDWLKSGEVSAMDIYTVYGVPGEIVGLGAKTFNNFREAKLSFYVDTVLPILDSLRDDVLNKDVTPEFGENLWLDYDKDDIEALAILREQKFTSLASVNFLKQNEKRELVGKEPVEGWDVFVIGNQVGENPEDFAGGTGGFGEEGLDETDPANPDADPNKKPPTKKPKPDEEDEDLDDDETEDEDEKGWKSFNLLNSNEKRASWKRQNNRRKRLAGGFKRDLIVDLNDLAAVMAKASKHTDDIKLKEFAILNAMDQFMPTIERTISKYVRFTLEDFGGMVLRDGKSQGLVTEVKAGSSRRKYDEYVQDYVKTRTGTAITEIAGTTRKQVRRIVQEWVSEAITAGDSADELAKYLQTEFEGLSAGRAQNIALTEVGMASSNGSLGAAKALGIPLTKEWVSADDGRTREDDEIANHVAMNGVKVDINEKFTVPPDADMDCPGDPAGGASQVCKCRCVLAYAGKGSVE